MFGQREKDPFLRMTDDVRNASTLIVLARHGVCPRYAQVTTEIATDPDDRRDEEGSILLGGYFFAKRIPIDALQEIFGTGKKIEEHFEGKSYTPYARLNGLNRYDQEAWKRLAALLGITLVVVSMEKGSYPYEHGVYYNFEEVVTYTHTGETTKGHMAPGAKNYEFHAGPAPTAGSVG